MTLLSEYEGMCQVELVDVVVELPNVNPTVVLRERGGTRELCFPIGQADGVTLSMARRGIATPRPLTHELMADIFVRFGIDLDVVRITGRHNKIYLAELVLSREGERQSVACRPSDALALALRRLVPVPIMVADGLLQPGPAEPAATAPDTPGSAGLEELPSAWPFAGPQPDVWPALPWLAEPEVAPAAEPEVAAAEPVTPPAAEPAPPPGELGRWP